MKLINKLLVVSAVAACSMNANSANLLLGGTSLHYDGINKYNTENYTIGLCSERFCGAIYKNSYYEWSALAYYQNTVYTKNNFGFGYKIGVMGGYRGHESLADSTGGIMPMVSATLSYKIESVTVEANVSPYVTMFNITIDIKNRI